jgi:hypothetical protein
MTQNKPTFDAVKKQKKRTPTDLSNQPNLSALKYRVGTHNQFKADMIEQISHKPALKNLTTRDNADLSIALLDSWAMIADVLTFYQERIANEGYLRTATERRSVLELARTIGYELKPGVAASVSLAFIVENATGSPLHSRVDEGTQVMSIPGQDEKLQTFETIETIEAKATLNDLRPIQFVTQKIVDGLTELYLKGVKNNLVPGDAILFVGSERVTDIGSRRWAFRFLHTVTINPAKNYTYITWKEPLRYNEIPNKHPHENSEIFVFRQQASLFGYNAPDWKAISDSLKLTYSGEASDGTNSSQESTGLPSDWPKFDQITTPIENDANPDSKVSVHLDAIYSNIFPESWVIFSGQRVNKTQQDISPIYSMELGRVTNVTIAAQSAFTLSDKTTQLDLDVTETRLCGFMRRDTLIFCVSEPLELTDKPIAEPIFADKIVLDHKVSELKIGQKIIIQGKPAKDQTKKNLSNLPKTNFDDNTESEMETCRISIAELLSSYSDKTTIHDIFAENSKNIQSQTDGDRSVNTPPAKRKNRRTTEYVNVVTLSLQDLKTFFPSFIDKGWTLLNPRPMVDASGVLRWRVSLSNKYGETIECYAVNDLNHEVNVSLDKADPDTDDTSLVSEVVSIKDLSDTDGTTTITLEVPDGKLCALSNVYDLASVHIYANIALATHGETTYETLGSGNSLDINQQFRLKKPPLTHVSAATTSGAKSTLKVYINDIQWQEVPTLYSLGPKDLSYFVRIEDNGDTLVTFGDGLTGARLPSGTENITTSYRSGIGLQGNVAANKLTLLTKKPFGIRSVTNPTPATGAASAEQIADAKINAPPTVLTLGRIVSLKDYENFAKTFLGIAKAHALAESKGKDLMVRLIVALVDAKPLVIKSLLYKNLQEAIATACAYGQKVRLESFTPVYFNVECMVYVNSTYIAEQVSTNVKAALLDAFSFTPRSFKQHVTKKEILTVIQTVSGVTYADNITLSIKDLTMISLETLCLTDDMLLMINPEGITLEVKQ